MPHDELSDELDEISPFSPATRAEVSYLLPNPRMSLKEGASNRARVVGIFGLVCTVILSGYLGWNLHRPTQPGNLAQVPLSSQSQASGDAPSVNGVYDIMVDVQGDVVHPGVVRVSESARVQDAIKKAGGFRHTGDASLVNAAAELEDGQEIVVPSVAHQTLPEAPAGKTPSSSSLESNVAPIQPTLDLNTVGAASLETLPGIGPTRAEDIISYREAHGPFPSVEALQQVHGIGPTIFGEIAPYLFVEGEKP